MLAALPVEPESHVSSSSYDTHWTASFHLVALSWSSPSSLSLLARSLSRARALSPFLLSLFSLPSLSSFSPPCARSLSLFLSSLSLSPSPSLPPSLPLPLPLPLQFNCACVLALDARTHASAHTHRHQRMLIHPHPSRAHPHTDTHTHTHRTHAHTHIYDTCILLLIFNTHAHTATLGRDPEQSVRGSFESNVFARSTFLARSTSLARSSREPPPGTIRQKQHHIGSLGTAQASSFHTFAHEPSGLHAHEPSGLHASTPPALLASASSSSSSSSSGLIPSALHTDAAPGEVSVWRRMCVGKGGGGGGGTEGTEDAGASPDRYAHRPETHLQSLVQVWLRRVCVYVSVCL